MPAATIAETIQDAVNALHAQQMRAARAADSDEFAAVDELRRMFRSTGVGAARTMLHNDAGQQSFMRSTAAIRPNSEIDRLGAFAADSSAEYVAETTRSSATRGQSDEEHSDTRVAEIEQRQSAAVERIVGLLRERYVAKNDLAELAQQLDDLDREVRIRSQAAWTSVPHAGPESFVF